MITYKGWGGMALDNGYSSMANITNFLLRIGAISIRPMPMLKVQDKLGSLQFLCLREKGIPLMAKLIHIGNQKLHEETLSAGKTVLNSK